MTLYDSSVLIDYLAGDGTAIDYIEAQLDERAVAPPLVLFEVYQGEVFKSGPMDLTAVDGALEWLTVVDTTGAHARAAAELKAPVTSTASPWRPEMRSSRGPRWRSVSAWWWLTLISMSPG